MNTLEGIKKRMSNEKMNGATVQNGIGLIKRIMIVVGIAVLVVIVLFGFLFAFSVKWLIKTCGLLTFDEIVYHFKTSVAGTNSDMVLDYIIGYGLWAVLLALVLCIAAYVVIKKTKYRVFPCLALLGISVLSIAYAYHELDMALGVTDYLSQELFPERNREDFVADYYVDTSKVAITFPGEGGVNRNLIYIWLESMETTYADRANGGAFEKNMIPEMTELAEVNECFSSGQSELNGGIALPGANWTTGAMFAQTTGLPLKIPLSSHQLDTQHDFFPTITSLGDILATNGYNQTFLVGSEASFGGMVLYFSGHGDFRIRDYQYALENGDIPKGYYEWWGYEDEKLYEFAKDELLSLASQDKPFNLMMCTADTHFEDGYVCRLCNNEFGDNQYANVIACASRQLAAFIEWIREQDFYENTTIVISGDHLTMDSDFCKDVPPDYQRTTYTCILNADAKSENTNKGRTFSTMDLFPTTLAALGCKIDGDQLGLGVNLYSGKETLVEQYGIPVMKAKLGRSSAFMNKLSGFSSTESQLEGALQSMVIETANEDGCIKFTVRKLHRWLTKDSIDRLFVCAVYHDPENGGEKQKTYECDVVLENTDDPNKFVGIAETDIPYDQLQSMQAYFYITAGECENYYLREYSYEDEQKWLKKKKSDDD